MKILLNNRAYETEDANFINNLLENTRSIFEDRGQFAIYALEKKNFIEFTKSVFPSKKELLFNVTRLTKAGFKVHFYSKE